MVHSDAISNDVIEVGTAKKILKAKDASEFWRCLKRFVWSWNCW